MQIESKKKVKASIEEQIKVKEERIKQESNHLKMLKKKLNKENRKKRDKRIYEKGAIFESIFKQTTKFTKDEYYELIAYAGTLDEFKLKIMEIEDNRKLKESFSKNN